jgi:hypothetical protein
MQIVIQLKDIVSQRLIHECLDEKYKQEYRSENAKKQKKAQDLAAKVPLNEETITSNVLLDTQGNTLIEPSGFNYDSAEYEPACLNCESRNLKILELQDALRKTTKLSIAENVLPKGKFRVLKEDEATIVDAFEKCSTCCYLIFNADGVLASVRPDTSQVDINEYH